jgi:hypothetical protein
MTPTRFLLALLLAACTGDDPASSQAALAGDEASRCMGPPPEALEACEGAAAGDDCAFETPDGRTLEGRCHEGPVADAPLACVPPPPPEAIAACDGAAAGDDCAFTFDGRSLEGSCHEGPDADAPLACAPPPPR